MLFVFLTHVSRLGATETLNFAVSISNSAQREAFYTLAQEFERTHPQTRIELTSFTSEIYKQKFPELLNSTKYDLLYWHAGERLFE